MALSFYSSTQFSGTKISTTGAGFTKCSPDSIKYNSNRISAAAAAATTSTERPTSSSSSSQYLSFNLSSSSPYQSSLYQVLGISMNATCQEIKSAYRKLARVFHPDVIDDTSSADQFMKIHEAYSTLSDPLQRADYDRELFTTRRRSPLCYTSSSSSSSSRPTSNWETDQCW